jgi:hypothetical protein
MAEPGGVLPEPFRLGEGTVAACSAGVYRRTAGDALLGVGPGAAGAARGRPAAPGHGPRLRTSITALA